MARSTPLLACLALALWAPATLGAPVAGAGDRCRGDGLDLDLTENLANLVIDLESDLFPDQVLLTLDGPVTVADNHRLVERLLAVAEQRLEAAGGPGADPVEALLIIHRLLKEEGFVFTDHSSWDHRLLGFGLFNHGLARRRIDCTMYVFLYLAIAERVELPLAGIGMPEHMALRWIPENGSTFNWEATVPNLCDDAFYVDWKRPDRSAVARGVYLRNLDKGEVLAAAYYNKSLALYERRELDLAAAALDRALVLYPDQPDEHNLHGLILAASGDPRRAVAAFDTALDLDPAHSPAAYNRARSHLALGEIVPARRDLKVLRRLDADLAALLEPQIVVAGRRR